MSFYEAIIFFLYFAVLLQLNYFEIANEPKGYDVAVDVLNFEYLKTNFYGIMGGKEKRILKF